MRVVDSHDSPLEDVDGEDAEVDSRDGGEETPTPVRIIEGHAVQFNEYRY